MGDYDVDSDFSTERDHQLSDYWKINSYEGRFNFAKKTILQKINSIDIILQTLNDENILVDTKHRRPCYMKYRGIDFLLEEESNSVRHVPGWILHNNGHPDIIFYAFWNYYYSCCYSYMIPFKELREWFIPNYKKYEQKKTSQVNKTTSRVVPYKDLLEAIPRIIYHEEKFPEAEDKFKAKITKEYFLDNPFKF